MTVTSPKELKKNEGKVEDVMGHNASVVTEKITVDISFNPQERAQAERALLRKLDMRLVPITLLILIMNYIDRTAISAARLSGLEEDLGLSDLRYDTVVAIIYVSYSLAQIPSNVILNKVSRPSLYIGTCVVIWGIISTLTGITQNYAGILLCRIFLGIPEAAFYPGATYLFSRWYTRKQLAFRTAVMYCGLLMANAFGSLLAAGISGNMDGKRGIRAWRWIFLIEGAITIVVGLTTMYILPDYPHNTRWLNPAELRLAQLRLAEETGEADNDGVGDSAWSGLKMALKDIKVIILVVMTGAQLLGFSYINFFPTLAATLGYSPTISLLLAAPPWIFAAIVALINSRHADYTGERFFHIAGCWWAVILGYIISLSTMAVGGRYLSMFLMTAGHSAYTLTMVWVSNTVPRPPAKRAAAIGLVNGFGAFGSLIGSFVWKAKWGPKYHQSMIIALCALVLSTILALVLRQILIRENQELDAQEILVLKGADRQRVEEYAHLEGITFAEAVERKKGYRFLY